MSRADGRVWCVVCVVGTIMTAAVTSARAGDPQAGLGLAARYCDFCHSVERSLNPPNLAPPLLDLAQHTRGNSAWLRAWLNAPHPPLRTSLSRKQIDDIVAYLARLTKSY
jgi:mono/diheme cytochrome c family protein